MIIIIREKLKIKLFSKEGALLVLISVSILTIYTMQLRINQQETFLSLLRNDFFLWIVFNLSITSINSEEILRISYFELSRIETKDKRFKINSYVIAFSTIFYSLMIFLIGYLIQFSIKNYILDDQYWIILYLLYRYILISLLLQFCIYILVSLFPKIRKHNGFANVLALLGFLIFTLPYELTTLIFQTPIFWIDMSASGILNQNGENIQYFDVLMGNLHILAYLVTVILIYKWFFMEKEEYIQ